MTANDFKSMADEQKPREKMARAPSLREVSGEDLLAVVLKTGSQGCDVSELSSRLIAMFGSTAAFVRCASDWRALRERIKVYNEEHPEKRILGAGDVKLQELAASIELARRGFAPSGDDDDSAPAMPEYVRNVDDAVRAFRVSLAGRGEQENFFVLPVDVKSAPMSEPICVTRGTIVSTPVHPREVFKEAVRWGAHAVFVAHNHPSGDPTPSRDDIVLTQRLLEASSALSIPLIDHIVIGSGRGASGSYVSFRAAKLVEFPDTKPASRKGKA